MKILLVHEYYQQAGGEDAVFTAESALLRSAGHEVVEFTEDNARITEMSPWTTAAATLWNRRAASRLGDLVDREQPDVVHFHNTFPLVSPAAYYAVRRRETPVVQTLHNYRLLCVNGLFFRDGHACQDCLGRLPWPGILHRCYRSSRAGSATVASMLALHRALGTWSRRVDAFITLTRFARAQFVAGGLPEEKLVVKPNFLPEDPGMGRHHGGFALFVGRLSHEKGIEVLLDAWKLLGPAAPELVIVGAGPLSKRVHEAARQSTKIEYRGQRPRDEVLSLMRDATLFISPSLCFEGMPITLVEAFATGLPVVASDLGSQAEIIDDSETGWLVPPGDPTALTELVSRATADPDHLATVGRSCRRRFEQRYTADANLEMVLSIYSQVGAGNAAVARHQ